MRTDIILKAAGITGIFLLSASGVFALSTHAKAPSHALTGASLSKCQTQEATIQNELATIAGRGQIVENNDTLILTKVEGFYTAQMMLNGKGIPNYNSMQAMTQKYKLQLDEDIATLQSHAINFTCTESDPHGDLQSMQQTIVSMQGDIQSYRAAIYSLIAAMRNKLDNKTS